MAVDRIEVVTSEDTRYVDISQRDKLIAYLTYYRPCGALIELDNDVIIPMCQIMTIRDHPEHENCEHEKLEIVNLLSPIPFNEVNGDIS